MSDLVYQLAILPLVALGIYLIEYPKAACLWVAYFVRKRIEQARFDRALDAWRDERRRPAARRERGAAGRAPYPSPPRVKADTTSTGEASR